jgi:DNA-directed RNA polymerase subunit H (RpoH/RPB5)
MVGALNHSMVPLHEIISSQEAYVELAPWELEKTDFEGNSYLDLDLLPKIGVDDPALFDASLPRPPGVSTTWPVGEVVRITRRSAFAGISMAYRLVVGTAVFDFRERSDLQSPEPDDWEDDDDDGWAELSDYAKEELQVRKSSKKEDPVELKLDDEESSELERELFGGIDSDDLEGDGTGGEILSLLEEIDKDE